MNHNHNDETKTTSYLKEGVMNHKDETTSYLKKEDETTSYLKEKKVQFNVKL